MTVDLQDRLYNEAGTPVSGATVELYDNDGASSSLVDSTTTVSGEWDFTGAAEPASGHWLDVKIISGSQVRYRYGNIKAMLAALYVKAVKVVTSLTLGTSATLDASAGVLKLPQSTSIAPTVEGSIGWDTDDNLLKVGDGSGTKTMVDLASSQTLTNKTLTSPVIGTISNTGTLTLPTSTDTLVGRATTDTLTNKTLTTPTLTLKQSAGAAPTASGDIQYDTTSKQLRYGDGTNTRVLADNLLDRDTTPTTVASTASEASVYSFSVPAGAMGTNRAIRLSFFGLLTENNGANGDIFFNVSFGGNRIMSGMAENLPASANPRGVRGQVIIGNNGANNAQHASLSVTISGPAAMNSVSSAGISEATAGSTGPFLIEVVNTSLAVDTGSAQTLELKVRHDASSANQSITIHECWLELL